MRRVVVTGMGMVTPLGDGVDTNWRKLMAAESGIRAIQAFDTSDLATKIAGEVPQGDKQLAQHLERLEVNVALRVRDGEALSHHLTR